MKIKADSITSLAASPVVMYVGETDISTSLAASPVVMYVDETDIITSLAASSVIMYVDETDIITSLAASPVVMYVETFKTDVVVSIDYVIMCLTSHLQIIFSIRVNFMMLTISLSEIKAKTELFKITNNYSNKMF